MATCSAYVARIAIHVSHNIGGNDFEGALKAQPHVSLPFTFLYIHIDTHVHVCIYEWWMSFVFGF